MQEPNFNDQDNRITQLIEQHQHLPGALLPLLHAVQQAFGYIPPTTVPAIAEALALSRAEVHGVISFYHGFRSQPCGRNVLQICCAEACQARGSRQLAAHTRQQLGVDFHQTTADGEITLEPVYCLGNCATGPSVRIGDRVLGRVDAATMDRLLDELTRVPLRFQSEPMASETGDTTRGSQ
ncbi:formate dehydrogenase subunit gamma [Marinobacter sp. NP-4(2019)]|uniref:formate dehydrogenase subunit gamma n=1 Tax=Marinobacter sp. NP-4(2019) TaxID=2488665 RepID=UPI000FC3F23E|nr:formate dehydrogenase subunit gamma [Marinobacter sp. NP-4(2019)]AZT84797.1 formate dehydrogenase subunit gamma [Marinobacter sp. NP-4(2019)]